MSGQILVQARLLGNTAGTDLSSYVTQTNYTWQGASGVNDTPVTGLAFAHSVSQTGALVQRTNGYAPNAATTYGCYDANVPLQSWNVDIQVDAYYAGSSGSVDLFGLVIGDNGGSTPYTWRYLNGSGVQAGYYNISLNLGSTGSPTGGGAVTSGNAYTMKFSFRGSSYANCTAMGYFGPQGGLLTPLGVPYLISNASADTTFSLPGSLCGMFVQAGASFGNSTGFQLQNFYVYDYGVLGAIDYNALSTALAGNSTFQSEITALVNGALNSTVVPLIGTQVRPGAI